MNKKVKTTKFENVYYYMGWKGKTKTTNKNVLLQDMSGNNLFPKTLGSVVFNNNN